MCKVYIKTPSSDAIKYIWIVQARYQNNNSNTGTNLGSNTMYVGGSPLVEKEFSSNNIAFDLKFAEKIGTDFGIALVPRFYLKKDKIAPYFGLRAGVLINKPSSENEVDTETKLDLLGGVAFGGEYFLSDYFSFGVEVQGNLTKSDKNSNRFGNPDGINFNTGTLISATVYF